MLMKPLNVNVFVLVRRPSPTPPSGRGRDPQIVGLVGAAAALLLGLLAVAVIAPTNTWDSLQYHLPRARQWIQQGSV